jgi:hypothetical protein
MKELLNGLITFIASIILTPFILAIAVPYAIGYNFYMMFAKRKFLLLFILTWRIIDGLCAAIGYILFHFSVGLDMIWNVCGEIFEDIFTCREDSYFGEKNITVSSSIGHLEKTNSLYKAGKRFSKLLNLVFKQKQHALDSWELHVKITELKSKYFN